MYSGIVASHFIQSQLTASFNMLWMISGDNMDDYIMKHVYASSTSSAHYVRSFSMLLVQKQPTWYPLLIHLVVTTCTILM